MSTPPFQPPPPPSPPHAFGQPSFPAPSPGYAAPAGPLKRPGGVIVIAILNFFGGVGGLFYGAIMAVAGATAGAGGDVPPGLMVFFVIFAVVIALMSVFTIATGIGLLMLKSWGRTCQMVLSAIGLIGIPIGTVINGIILYYLTRPGIKLLYSGRPAESFSHEERALIAKGSGSGAMIAVVLAVLLIGGIAVVGIIAAIAIPGLLRARMAGNEASAIGSMRSMNSAQAVWSSSATPGAYAEPHCLAAPTTCGIDSPTPFLQADLGSLSEKSGYNFGFALRMVQPVVDPAPAAPVESGEGLSDAEVQRQLEGLAAGDAMTPAPPPEPTPQAPADPVAAGYVYWAVPVTWGTTGNRIFCSDESGLVLEYLTQASWTEPSADDAKCPDGGQPLQ